MIKNNGVAIANKNYIPPQRVNPRTSCVVANLIINCCSFQIIEGHADAENSIHSVSSSPPASYHSTGLCLVQIDTIPKRVLRPSISSSMTRKKWCIFINTHLPRNEVLLGGTSTCNDLLTEFFSSFCLQFSENNIKSDQYK